MDGDAFLFMLISWGIILGLNVFCFTLLLTRKEDSSISKIEFDVDRDDEIT